MALAEDTRTHEPPRAKPYFTYVESGELHFARRREIIANHPEIRTLFGTDSRVAWTTTAVLCAQLIIAYALMQFAAPMWLLVVVAFFVGSILNHWLAMTVHETSHFLVFKSKDANRWLAIFANIPILLPLAMSFHRYHLAHHQYLGVDVHDSDLPHWIEVRGIGNSRVRKLVWLLLNNFFYMWRGLTFAKFPPTRWEVMNIGIIIVTNFVLAQFLGVSGMVYLLLSTMFGLSFHPVAAHFIHEHYVFEPGQETYSYYGPLNHVTFNVGYHNEHHDFMGVPGANLPALRAMAPEAYATLKSHTSWTYVLYKFVMDRDMGLHSRIVRDEEAYRRGRLRAVGESVNSATPTGAAAA